MTGTHNLRHFRPLRSKSLQIQASTSKESATSPKQYLPRSADEVVDQALQACRRAYADGVRRQQLELLLPLIGATDLDDWPGGIRQQFKAASPMVEGLLKGLKKEDQLQGPLSSKVLDQGDAVGAWFGKDQGGPLAAILFATSETLKQVREIAENVGDSGLTLLINPQWQAGNLVSDFGVGPWRRRSEDLVASFEDVYTLKQIRISGDNIKILHTYPGGWQVYIAPDGQKPQLLTVLDQRPSYKALQEVLRDTEGSSSGKTWVEKLRSEFAFNRDSIDDYRR
ncbi:g1091 [Coccomyxa viridis]|uniref:G1091 protein n=1 Tax=Coccomyxa viridis TaxID=1274662 RepID=A0ABP1FP15_9CHLO